MCIRDRSKINGFIVSIETVIGMSHFSYTELPQMETTFIPGVVGTPHMKGVGIIVANFELNP